MALISVRGEAGWRLVPVGLARDFGQVLGGRGVPRCEEPACSRRRRRRDKMADPGKLPGARWVPARPPQTGGFGQAELGAGVRYCTGGLRTRLGLGEGGGV